MHGELQRPSESVSPTGLKSPESLLPSTIAPMHGDPSGATTRTSAVNWTGTTCTCSVTAPATTSTRLDTLVPMVAVTRTGPAAILRSTWPSSSVCPAACNGAEFATPGDDSWPPPKKMRLSGSALVVLAVSSAVAARARSQVAVTRTPTSGSSVPAWTTVTRSLPAGTEAVDGSSARRRSPSIGGVSEAAPASGETSVATVAGSCVPTIGSPDATTGVDAPNPAGTSAHMAPTRTIGSSAASNHGHAITEPTRAVPPSATALASTCSRIAAFAESVSTSGTTTLAIAVVPRPAGNSSRRRSSPRCRRMRTVPAGTPSSCARSTAASPSNR